MNNSLQNHNVTACSLVNNLTQKLGNIETRIEYIVNPSSIPFIPRTPDVVIMGRGGLPVRGYR